MGTAHVPVVSATIRWARQAVHLTVDDLAAAIGVTPDRVRAWEHGDADPTIRQLQAVANRLDRTVAFFLLPPPIETGVPETADFRGRGDTGPSSTVARELKRAQAHRNYYLEVTDERNQAPYLRPIGWDNIEEVAAAFRTRLAPEGPTAKRDLKTWISRLEDAGFLVFQTTGISLSEFRGISVFHDALPIIVLNGGDSERARIFSLFHEVAHLSNRSSAMCLNLERSDEEVLCNRFSAEFLMPRVYVSRLARSEHDSSEMISRIASEFGVSLLAAAIRLFSLGYIEREKVDAVRKETDRAWERKRQRDKEKDGSPPYWRLRYRDLGSKYVRAVVGALDDSRIDHLDASYMLNVKVPTVEKLQQEVHAQGGR